MSIETLMDEIQYVLVKIQHLACCSVGTCGWKTCVLVFFACILVNNNKQSSTLEPEKETVSKETLIAGIRISQVFVD